MTIDPATLEAVRKLIDYELSGAKMWFDKCTGDRDMELKRKYQMEFNALFILKEKLTVENLTKNGEAYATYPDFKERIFIKAT